MRSFTPNERQGPRACRCKFQAGVLQRQLGHKDIQQTMHYAEFHPQYGDVGMYMDCVGRDVFGQESVDPVPEPVPAANRKESDSAQI